MLRRLLALRSTEGVQNPLYVVALVYRSGHEVTSLHTLKPMDELLSLLHRVAGGFLC
jgi:hypothetical protein